MNSGAGTASESSDTDDDPLAKRGSGVIPPAKDQADSDQDLLEPYVHSQATTGEDARDAVAVLRRHWLRTFADWTAVRAACKEPSGLGLPALLVLRLDAEAARRAKAEAEAAEPIYDVEHFEALAATDEDHQDCRIVRELKGYREADEVHKTLVKVFVNELADLSTAEQSVAVDIGVQFFFVCPHHVGAAEGAPDAERVWKPKVQFDDAIDMAELIDPDQGGSFYIRDSYRAHGIVNWYQRFKGVVRVSFDLKRFPFDTQTVTVRFGCTLSGADAVLLLNRSDPALMESLAQHMEAIHEFELVGVPTLTEQLVFNVEDKRDISYLQLQLVVRRKTGFYLANVVAPVLLLASLFLWQFLIDPNTLNDRLQIAITCFLALVAFNFVVVESLPKISHSTPLTTFFNLNYALISFGAVESGVSFLVDRYVDGGFDIAKIIDWSCMGVLFAVDAVTLIVLLRMGRR